MKAMASKKSEAQTKNPWLKFYPADWRSDPALRICSLGARGLWIEMLCIMHEAEPRGFLIVNGKSLSERQLASLVGSTQRETEGYLSELEEAGVFSRGDNGAIYSRRILRDEEKAEADKANGKRGGNPKLKAADNSIGNGRVNPPDKAQKPEARGQKEDNLAAQHSTTREPAPPRLASVEKSELDLVEANCRKALGEHSPVDLVIGPMVEIVRKFGQDRVALALASESRRPRQKPVKTWKLWSQIVSESLAEQSPIDAKSPQNQPDDPDDPYIPLVSKEAKQSGTVWKKSQIIKFLAAWKEDHYKWPPGMPEPDHPDCMFPRWIIEECGISLKKSSEIQKNQSENSTHEVA